MGVWRRVGRRRLQAGQVSNPLTHVLVLRGNRSSIVILLVEMKRNGYNHEMSGRKSGGTGLGRQKR